MPEGRDLAIIVPTRDRWPILQQTLRGLSRQTATGFETIVVVDGKDQNVPDLRDARAVVKERGGPGAARNTGAHETSRDLVLFLGDDMIPEPELVVSHLRAHSRDPAPNTAVLGHVSIHPTARRNRLNRWMEWSGTQFDFRNIAGEDAGYGRFYSCNVSLKRDFFLEAGGFDEDFTYYYEDLDLGWRLHEKGLRLLYEPRAVAQHYHPLGWQDVVRRFEGVASGERLMASKHSWFDPYFAGRVRQALRRPHVGRAWPAVVNWVPRSLGLRRAVERRADTWYYQQLGPYFLRAWDEAGEATGRLRKDGTSV